MKAILLTALAAGLLPANVALADGCSSQTLVGTVFETIQRTTPAGPGTSIYMETWDGAGNIQYLQDDATPTSTSGLYNGTGTYTVSADCIATVIYDGDTSRVWQYYLDPDGRGYTWLNAFNIGKVAGGHADLVTRFPLVDVNSTAPGPCTLETLHGTMARSAEGIQNGAPFVGVSIEVYDGAGNARYFRTVSNGYTTSSANGTATYTITDRCVASVTYEGASSPMIIFVTPSGSAYYWMDESGSGSVIAGKAQRTSHRRRDH